ncbi:MAG: Snf7 family protein [Candidatus Bathyarchaeia archaeon]
MVKGFTDRWKHKQSDEPSLAQKIKNVGQPSVSLKEQITQVTQRLDNQTRMLDMAVQRFQNRDAEIFNRIIKAMAQRDQDRANILATELSEIRKVKKMLSHASLALQSVSMRLSTVSELGDVVAVLSPAKGMLNNIRTEMGSIMPEASQELGNIGNLLSEIVTTTNQSSEGPSLGPSNSNPEAMQILAEAESMAEMKLRDQLPEISAEPRIAKRASLDA